MATVFTDRKGRPNMSARYLVCLVAFLLVISPLSAAEGSANDDFLVVFGQALAQAPENGDTVVDASEDLPDVRPATAAPRNPFFTKPALGVIRKLADAFGLAAGFMAIVAFFVLTTAAFVAFTLAASARRAAHLADLADLADERPWKTLGLGLLNFLLAVVACAILFRPGHGLLGLLFLAWFVGLLLEGLAARAIRTGSLLFVDADARPVRTAAIGALVQWPLFFIPVYGQVTLAVTALRGLGAKVWLRFRRSDGPTQALEDADTVVKTPAH